MSGEARKLWGWSGLAVALPTVLAAALTVTRVPFRWTPIALAYGAYYREYFAALERDGLAGLVQFVGIHPPAYSLAFLGMSAAGASANTWFLVSGALSVLAVGAVGVAAHRAGMGPWLVGLAGLLLAVSPHRLAYALEPNNYPLLLCVVAVQGAVFARFLRGGSGGWLMASTALGLWTHALFVTVPIAQAAALLWSRDARARKALVMFGGAVALCLPLVPSVLAGAGSAVNEGGGLAGVARAMLIDFPSRYGEGWAAWVVGGLAVLGAVGVVRGGGVTVGGGDPVRRTLLGTWVAQVVLGGGLLALLLATGTAATHQFPYYLLLLPPGCLLAASALGSRLPLPARALCALLVGLAALSSLQWSLAEAARGRESWRTAAVQRPMVARAIGAWTEGSSLLLIGYSSGGDDDKDMLDPAFALLPRDQPLSHASPDVPTLVGGDPYWGQPYGFPGERWLYTFTSFSGERIEAIFQAHRGRGERLIVVAYDTERAPEDAALVQTWGRSHGSEPLMGPGSMLLVFGPGPLP